MYKLVVFVPLDAKEKVKNALFEQGAGRLGAYSHCCWESEGIGQFKPLEGSLPVIGSHDRIEKVAEARIEMLVQEELVPLCIEAIRISHPYEVPAFELFRVSIDESELEGQEWL